ncbi:hypothetical protein F0562_015361 [Nyssa sinensis]|uniref:Uncharacterized protein n=1 Tax=Nyssa sinensis TaxID=561372 RepID=A0A5J4ZKU9_9ASTE|nr:hypothetical protein F0562_015361 [Nyssa sinensis]
MAEKNVDDNPATSRSLPGEKSDSCEDPPISATASSGELKAKKRDPDMVCEPKRKKNCPSALDNFESIKPSSNSNFSFSFDTDFVATPEVTPKFGSFNMAAVASRPEMDQCSQNPASKEKVEEGERAVSGEKREAEAVDVLSSAPQHLQVEAKMSSLRCQHRTSDDCLFSTWNPELKFSLSPVAKWSPILSNSMDDMISTS